MANFLWGKVYYKDQFSGYLREEPGNVVSFIYDETYLNSGQPAIAFTLPLQATAFISPDGLLSFFDNLVAEGWLEQAQTRLLGKRKLSRFELLLAFGADCAGAVSVMDPEPEKLSSAMLDLDDPKEMALMTSRASLSGVQPKIMLVEKNGKLLPAQMGQLSTHIAKFKSHGHDDLLVNEYLTTRAFQALLPDDDVVDLKIGEIDGFSEPALIIKRFDRVAGERVHFEEFNQLLDRKSADKYEASHQEMADFIRTTKGCLPVETYRLYARVLAGILLGNTDMHLKNFAMFHGSGGLRLTPSYDQVSAVIYNYKTLALSIGGASNLRVGNLKPKHVFKLGEEFGLLPAAVDMLIQKLQKNMPAAKQAITEAPIGSSAFKNQLIKLMETRWNGTFALIGQSLLKKL